MYMRITFISVASKESDLPTYSRWVQQPERRIPSHHKSCLHLDSRSGVRPLRLAKDGQQIRVRGCMRSTWGSGWNTVPLRDSLEKSACEWNLDLLRMFLAKGVGARLLCKMLGSIHEVPGSRNTCLLFFTRTRTLCKRSPILTRHPLWSTVVLPAQANLQARA